MTPVMPWLHGQRQAQGCGPCTSLASPGVGTSAAPAPWGKLLPEFLHTDQGMLPGTRTNLEELQPNQTSSSGYPSECLQLPFPAAKTLNIKQRELIYTWDIDTKQRKEEEKDKY